MTGFIANIFGYVLNFMYSVIKNYGLAIILFSVILKILLLPLSIKQQRTLKKTEKMQKELAAIQVKYKNDQEKLNQEMMALYKRNNMNPFTGCFGPIIQIIILFAMFSLVRSPLTYMLHINNDEVDAVAQYIKKEEGDTSLNQAYPQISIIKYVANNRKTIEITEDKETTDEVNKENQDEKSEEVKENKEENKKIDLNKMYINMNFLGLDLSDVPKENYKDIKVFIIPVLYVISSIISIKITTNMQKQKVKKEDDKDSEEKSDNSQALAMQMNKNMSFMMPFLSVMISLIAPLGLALYWLINNILMIIERVILDKIIDDKEVKENA